MRKFLIILLFLPTLLFAQLSKENDSTYVLRMSKVQMDRFFEKMVQYDVNDSLLQLEKLDNTDLKKMIAQKDSIIKIDSAIIQKKDGELNKAQDFINSEKSNKVDFWGGVHLGLNAESQEETQWKQLQLGSFKYSIIGMIDLKIKKITIRPSINLYLNNQSPKYSLNILYRIF